ncbi:hypothetical protein VZO05_08440 [Aggregatilineales bacterium SYSU G02658]
MSTLTRGGLVPAKLINLATQEEILCMFNPADYSISKQNTYEKRNIIGKDVPEMTFQQGGSVSLTLKLHFDTADTASDVRSVTNKLLKLMMIDPSTQNAATGKSSPPAVAFSWGRVYFRAVVTSMTQRFTLFKEDGTPLRCVVDITMEQQDEDPALTTQVQGTTSSGTQRAPSSGGGNTEQTTQGDRIDHVSQRGTGSSNNYRSVAENNNIDNPLRLQNGQTLKVK